MVVNWLNGYNALRDVDKMHSVHSIRSILANLWASGQAVPTPSLGNWIDHQFREHNAIADKLANLAVKERKKLWVHRDMPINATAIWSGFDGGLRKAKSGAG